MIFVNLEFAKGKYCFFELVDMDADRISLRPVHYRFAKEYTHDEKIYGKEWDVVPDEHEFIGSDIIPCLYTNDGWYGPDGNQYVKWNGKPIHLVKGKNW